MGKARTLIMEKCPEEFEDDLKDFIDKIENTVNSIKDQMDIKCISDIRRIDDAHDIIVELAEDLY